MARDARTNRRIRAREVRVIGAEGEQLGILSIDQALARAQEAGMDLVEVSPMAKPPVCKIMDYGKFKYEAKKKANEARKKQVVVRLKEVKLRPKTEEHDYEFKVNNIRRFLSDGDKARVTIMFRGREITHKDIGQRILSEVMTDLKDIAVMEQAPRMEGRQMFMILAPNPKLKAQAQAQARASVKPEQPRPPAPAPKPPAEGKPAEPAPAAATKP
ncbi:MAG TPA: translation initiation factor IF-3 [Myxococcales bacterium]|nr:translation initiation factor IF-3 [Myxococcales bacterium]